MGEIFKIIRFTNKFWKWYVAMGVFVVVVSLLSLAIPLLSKEIVDIVVDRFSGVASDFDRLVSIFILIILVDLAITLLTAIGQWLGDIMSVRLQTFLSSTFYKHLLNLDIGFYDNEITGKLVNKMYRGISSITDFMSNMTNNFLPFFLSAFVTIILLGQYSLVIAVLLAILFPAYILISHGSTIAWRRHEDKKNKINDISQGRVFESLTGIRVVKAFVGEIIELKHFLNARQNMEVITVDQTKQWHLYDFYRRLVLNIILFSIYVYVVYWTFSERFTLGEMTLLLQLVNQARFPLFAMSFILGQIQQANSGSKDFFEILNIKARVKDELQAQDLVINPDTLDLIKFEDVDFEYENNKNVLRNVNINISKGEKVALVGESGQGKSTLVNLLLRYYEPQKGKIVIGNHDISTVNQSSLREKMAVVFQDTLLFSGTITENIRYSNESASFEEVKNAAKLANALNFIEKLPNGFDSVVGERGVKLSGGQKQRVAIARAILKKAEIIILDEATSALDSKSENEVQEGLVKLLEGRTAIIIAHRLSTIANCDQIIVLANGTVAQKGKPAELLKDKSGLYYNLVKMQNEKLQKFDLVK